MIKYKYCPICKSNLSRTKHGETYRLSCRKCGWIHYANPLPSVAAYVRNSRNEVLLVRRGVTPGKGKWALPSGFIEQEELPEKAVVRELKEETSIDGSVRRLLGIYTEPTRVYGNILLIAYEIDFHGGKPKPGSDTKEARFFAADRLPMIPFASHRAIIKDGLTASRHRMLVEVLKSKITAATITHTQLFYKGSMGIDREIMRVADLVPGEKVHVLNYDNGERLVTYTIEERAGSRKIVLYGPASKKGKVGNKLCILAYAQISTNDAKTIKPKIVVLDKRNGIKRRPI